MENLSIEKLLEIKMKIHKITTVSLRENIYILSENQRAIIIDPGLGIDEIVQYLSDHSLTLDYILLTHGHADHIYGVEELRKRYHIPVLCSIKEKQLIEDKILNFSTALGRAWTVNCDEYFDSYKEIIFQNHRIEIIETPGHTSGSVCYKIDQNLFTGDTLFKGSVGRTDLYTGNSEEIEKSLRTLQNLDDSINVYPGHGDTTTIGYEKEFNPYMSF